MQRPSKLPAVSLSNPPTFSGPQGWADLPDDLLHSIVARLGSFRDLLGFTATCPSWRAAFSLYPSKSTFRTKFPPLLIQPHIPVQGPLLPCKVVDPANQPHIPVQGPLLPCKVVDPANQNTALRCWIPQDTLEKTFIGSSYGNLIYYCDSIDRYCRIIDVFTGGEVLTPCLPSSDECSKFHLTGILTAPLASPNSHLLVSTKHSLLDLPVGSDSWSEVQLPPCMLKIGQIVEFNGQFIVSDDHGRFYTVQLFPQLGLREITTQFHDTIEHPPEGGWLVVCGDMLLMHNASKLYRLDMSAEPATWMAVEKLDNWALFMGAGVKSTPHSCMSPELWGGRSNIVYSAHTFRPWALYGLCGVPDPMQDTPPIEPIVGSTHLLSSVSPLWLYPSVFYSDGQ